MRGSSNRRRINQASPNKKDACRGVGIRRQTSGGWRVAERGESDEYYNASSACAFSREMESRCGIRSALSQRVCRRQPSCCEGCMDENRAAIASSMLLELLDLLFPLGLLLWTWEGARCLGWESSDGL